MFADDQWGRHQISSAQTFWMKFAAPIVMNVCIGYAVLGLFGAINFDWFKQGQRIPPEVKWLFLAGWIYFNGLCLWINFRLKKVELDEENLYISNYMDEIVVPLVDVADVSQSRMMNPRPITIRFHKPTEFGDRIVFLSKQLWFDVFWRTHPVVDEIRSAVNLAAELQDRS